MSLNEADPKEWIKLRGFVILSVSKNGQNLSKFNI
jgi:hypothetical protein